MGYSGPSGIRLWTLHWDGAPWSEVPGAHPDVNDDWFYGLTAISANNVVAVGGYYNTSSRIFMTLVERWDGAQWRVVPSPNLGTYTNVLYGVTATTGGDVWAVGYYQDPYSQHRTLVLRNGIVVLSPSPDASYNHLRSVAAVSTNDVWMVGECCAVQHGSSLVERAINQCASPTHSPTAIATAKASATPTATPTAGPRLVGHVTWQGRPQPDPLSAIAITLTLRLQSGGPATEYTGMTTDAGGFFTVPVGSLPSGSYYWRVKDPKYLAAMGSVTLTGALVTGAEMGMQQAGDASNDNLVNVFDFATIKASFGKTQGQPGYDDRADFNGDLVVNSSDFTLLRANFGMGGAPPLLPGLRTED